MKRYIASDLSKVPSEKIGDLQMELSKIAQNKTLAGFLAQELANRRDAALWDEKMSDAEKVGHLKEIVGITGLLCGPGVQILQQVIQAKAEKKKAPQKGDKEVEHRTFKEEVLK